MDENLTEDLSRYKSALVLISKYANSHLRKHLQSMHDDLSLDEAGEPVSDEELKEARQLAEDLRTRGPAYIKLGQFLSTQTQIIPEEYAEVLAQLQDSIPAIPFQCIKDVIKADIDPTHVQPLLSGVSPEPLGVASLAQVYEATLPTGRNVVIKVQRPDVRDELRRDLRAFEKIATFFDSYVPVAVQYDFSSNFEQFKSSLLKELDLEQEAQNLRTLQRILKPFPLLYVPSPVARYSGSRVLTMDMVRGKKVDQLSDEELQGYDCEEIVNQLFHGYLRQILIEGFVHVDPHPGNLFLTADGRLAIIDVGMVAHIPDSVSENLLRIILEVAEYRGEGTARAVIDLGVPSADFDRAEFQNEIAKLVAEHAHLPVQDLTPGKLILQINRIALEAGLTLPSQFAILGQTLMKLDYVGTLLAPEFNPARSMREYSSQLMNERTQQGFSTRRIFQSLSDIMQAIGQIPRNVEMLTESLANNEFRMHIDAIDERELIRGIQKVANRITAGLVIAAMIVGAALLTRTQTEWQIAGYPGIAVCLFLFAFAMGVYLLVTILFTDRR